MPLTVLHQDRDVLAVDKPAGLLSVPGKGPDKADCAQARLEAEGLRVYPAHRLDMGTSGVLLFALRRSAERELHRQFREREVQKVYVARVAGHPSIDTGEIDAPLAVLAGEPRSEVSASGKAALTSYRVLCRDDDGTSLLELRPHTGRSHQLRVHLCHLGFPILGDPIYAPPGVASASERLCLHAVELRCSHPYSREPLSLRAPIPFR